MEENETQARENILLAGCDGEETRRSILGSGSRREGCREADKKLGTSRGKPTIRGTGDASRERTY